MTEMTNDKKQIDVISKSKENDEIVRRIAILEDNLELEKKKKYAEELEVRLKDLQESPKSEDVKTSSKITVYDATKRVVSQQKIGDKKNYLLQIPIEELLNLLGLSSEDIIDIEDNLIYELSDELAGDRNTRLRARLKLHKNKLIQQKDEDKQRLIQEEKIEHQRQLDEKKKQEEQAKIAKDEQFRRTYTPCPFCQQRTVNRKVLIKNEQARCENPSCGKIINYCPRCKSTVDDDHLHPEDLDLLIAFDDKYQQSKLERKQQQELLQQKQQEQLVKQQIKEQLVKQPIQYAPNLTETVLDSKFAQAALSRSHETIESLEKTIGKKKTEQLADAIAERMKK